MGKKDFLVPFRLRFGYLVPAPVLLTGNCTTMSDSDFVWSIVVRFVEVTINSPFLTQKPSLDCKKVGARDSHSHH